MSEPTDEMGNTPDENSAATINPIISHQTPQSGQLESLAPHIRRMDSSPSHTNMIYSAKNTESEIKRITVNLADIPPQDSDNSIDETNLDLLLQTDESVENHPDDSLLNFSTENTPPTAEILQTKAPKYILVIGILASAIIPLAIIYLLISQQLPHAKDLHKILSIVHNHNSPTSTAIPSKSSSITASPTLKNPAPPAGTLTSAPLASSTVSVPASTNASGPTLGPVPPTPLSPTVHISILPSTPPSSNPPPNLSPSQSPSQIPTSVASASVSLPSPITSALTPPTTSIPSIAP